MKTLSVLIQRGFQTSCNLHNKLSRVPYPWKNLKKDYPKHQYVSKILDNDLTEENKEFLLHKRIEESQDKNKETVQFLKTSEWPRNEYVPFQTQRVGLIGYKLGMMPHWTNEGKRKLLSIYQIMDNVALNYIPPREVSELFARNRHYMQFTSDWPSWVKQQRWGLQMVGAVAADPAEFKPEYSGLFTRFGVDPRRKLARFLISEDAVVEPGRELSYRHLRLGDYVDITARSINHGFEGVMIKNKFSGGPSLSATKFHRRPGCISHGVKVLRGKKLPGVMGNRRRTVRGLQVVRVDHQYGLLYVSGITPGPVHSYAHLYDTWLHNRISARERSPAMPTLYDTDNEWTDELQVDDDSDWPAEQMMNFLRPFDAPPLTFEQQRPTEGGMSKEEVRNR